MSASIAESGPEPKLRALWQALNAPELAEVATHLAEAARAGCWSYEEFLVACLEGEVAALTNCLMAALEVPVRGARNNSKYAWAGRPNRWVLGITGSVGWGRCHPWRQLRLARP